MSNDNNYRLVKLVVIVGMIGLIANVIIVAVFLYFIHTTAFEVTETTTLTAELDSTAIITSNESPVTTYPSMTTNNTTYSNKIPFLRYTREKSS